MALTRECIFTVLDALVGSTAAEADTLMDKRAQSNVPAFEAVCDWVAKRINEADVRYNSPYASAKETARMVINAAGDLSTLWDIQSGRCEWFDYENGELDG